MEIVQDKLVENSSSLNNDSKMSNHENSMDNTETLYFNISDVDTSDEEEMRNYVGNIPYQWYDEYQHIGYDLDGQKIVKPESKDKIDEFMKKIDDPNFMRTVVDRATKQEKIVSDEDLLFLNRYTQGLYTDPSYDPYEKTVEYFTSDVMKLPIKCAPPPKSLFVPKSYERMKVAKLARAIIEGRRTERNKNKEHKSYLLWENDNSLFNPRMHWTTPKVPLPDNNESYNPASEYLITDEERAALKQQAKKGKRSYIKTFTRKYDSLQSLPSYKRFINDRFRRCLDLYLCPRKRILKPNITADELLPKLPKPEDLRPFPTWHSMSYVGHGGSVNSISIDPTGTFLVSASIDRSIKIWNIKTTRCLLTIELESNPTKVLWCPTNMVILICCYTKLYLFTPNLIADKLLISDIQKLMENNIQSKDDNWTGVDEKLSVHGFHFNIEHSKDIIHCEWHNKGTYFATVTTEVGSRSIMVHHLSNKTTQVPFGKLCGVTQNVAFHPNKPIIFVATQNYVKLYDLQQQVLLKKLIPEVRWISSIAIHPSGDNLIIGSYDKKICWFDLDLSVRPYKVLNLTSKAVRKVSFHQNYPLFSAASDDGNCYIVHSFVSNDLSQNASIVPVKIIQTNQSYDGKGVLDCIFHPYEPWVFTAGSNGTINAYM